MWRSPAEDLIAHSAAFHPLLYAGRAIEHSAEKQPDPTQLLTFMRQRNISAGGMPERKLPFCFTDVIILQFKK